MRLFLALHLPKKERQRIHRAVAPLRDRDLPVRWVRPEDYHITLKFLGDVRPEDVDAIGEVADRVTSATPRFDAELSGFGAFPTIRRPSVLWLGVQASPELRCLKQDLEWGLAERGHERETRAFHPHVTLARATGKGGAGAFRGLDDLTAEMDFRAEIRVHTVDLVRSQPGQKGPRYTILHSSRLDLAG